MFHQNAPLTTIRLFHIDGLDPENCPGSPANIEGRKFLQASLATDFEKQGYPVGTEAVLLLEAIYMRGCNGQEERIYANHTIEPALPAITLADLRAMDDRPLAPPATSLSFEMLKQGFSLSATFSLSLYFPHITSHHITSHHITSHHITLQDLELSSPAKQEEEKLSIRQSHTRKR